VRSKQFNTAGIVSRKAFTQAIVVKITSKPSPASNSVGTSGTKKPRVIPCKRRLPVKEAARLRGRWVVRPGQRAVRSKIPRDFRGGHPRIVPGDLGSWRNQGYRLAFDLWPMFSTFWKFSLEYLPSFLRARFTSQYCGPLRCNRHGSTLEDQASDTVLLEPMRPQLTRFWSL
jgi:hypothetical protein